MNYIIQSLIPLKWLSFYSDYFSILYSIVVCRNLTTIGLVHTCITFCLLKFVHFIFLYLYQMDRSSRMIFFDIFDAFGMSNDNNLILACLCLLTALFYWQVYFGNYNRLSSILYQVLIEQNAGFFLSGKFKGEQVCVRVRRIALFIANLFQPMVLITELFAIFCQLFTLYNIYQHPSLFLNSLSGLMDLFLMELTSLFMASFMLMFTHICILLTCLGIVLTFIFFIKMDQIYLALMKHYHLTDRWLIGVLLSEIARLSRKNYLTFDLMNDMYVKMFCFNLLLNCPINAHLIISMIRSDEMTPFSVFFMGAFAFQQMASIFGIHLLGTMYSIKIHQCARPIASKYSSARPHFTSLSARFKVVHYIEDFHTRKRYGGYYWRVGLMTMFAFAKYLLLYGEFLMYMYKHAVEYAR